MPPIAVVKGDGTLISKDAALERPVETILSGPAASVAGARLLTGRDDAVVVDMGGTTTGRGPHRAGGREGLRERLGCGRIQDST